MNVDGLESRHTGWLLWLATVHHSRKITDPLPLCCMSTTPLHSTTTHTLIRPRYAQRFRCVGAVCEDSCCAGWHVPIDERTFHAYTSGQAPMALRARLAAVVQVEATPRPQQHARIALDAQTNACPLLEHGWCAIQRDWDEGHLSHTCFSYPRYTRQWQGQVQQALTLSCPEAARLALLSPDAMTLERDTATVRAEAVQTVATPASHGTTPATAVELNALRAFALQLVRTPNRPLWQRLAVLGQWCHELTTQLQAQLHPMADGAAHATVASSCPGLMAWQAEFTDPVQLDTLFNALEAVPVQRQLQAQVWAALWRRKGDRGLSSVQRQVIAAVEQGLGWAEDGSEVHAATSAARYADGLAQLPLALQTGAPHLLEHFVINELFRDVFPFQASTPWAQYVQLVVQVGLLRWMLAAQCSRATLPDTAALVRTVQVLCQRFQHDTDFGPWVANALNESALDTLPTLWVLLHD